MSRRLFSVGVLAATLVAGSLTFAPASSARTGTFVPPPKCIQKSQSSGGKAWVYIGVEETQYPYRTLQFEYFWGTTDAGGVCNQYIGG